MTGEDAVEAYAKFAFKGKPLSPEAQLARTAVEKYIQSLYVALPPSLKKSISWNQFYPMEVEKLHEEATRLRTKFAVMPKKA